LAKAEFTNFVFFCAEYLSFERNESSVGALNHYHLYTPIG